MSETFCGFADTLLLFNRYFYLWQLWASLFPSSDHKLLRWRSSILSLKLTSPQPRRSRPSTVGSTYGPWLMVSCEQGEDTVYISLTGIGSLNADYGVQISWSPFMGLNMKGEFLLSLSIKDGALCWHIFSFPAILWPIAYWLRPSTACYLMRTAVLQWEAREIKIDLRIHFGAEAWFHVPCSQSI